MDVSNAVLVVAAVTGLTALVKGLVPRISDPVNGRLVQVAAIVIAVGVLFLARETVWANEQIIGGKPLDRLDGWSVTFAGLLFGLAGSILDRTLKTVAQIGTPSEQYVEVPPEG